ncbi:MAG: Thiol-disulfide oxidoreductase ResA [Syntrophaceae bacterium PtaU1.Bin231]|nr:MAG: Thiol-disulfide oxidoreductase ResA [Syntrophaceae bacterium PtaU1.Bin231]HOG15757.1 TlpA disulfide reductase family protein [Syntrophales bacterium]
MKKSIAIAAVAAWMILGFVSGTPLFAQAPDMDAPAFTLPDLAGKKFSLADHKGKPVLIIFSTTWCPYCRTEIPKFKEIYNTYAQKGLVVVNVDSQEPRDKVAKFAEKYKLPYRVLIDEEGDVAESYGVRGVPTMVLIDGKGKILCFQCRSVDSSLKKIFGNP